ncbi:hypothetical protein HF325_006811 [Metschnikowia pulcherrima]|uniref:Protein kinase domain-containing protein n=1 Tax=Metschnikowia pulcherrima TaxID=27326 RepID=A0A8H7GLW7_9ASCO|nr:hypothetical protein HF325_006811 [Metschnikowia pulcherrima]
MSTGRPLSVPPNVAPVPPSLSPVCSPQNDTASDSPRSEEARQRQKLLGKMAHLLHRTVLRPETAELRPESLRAQAMTASPTSTSTVIDTARPTTPWLELSGQSRVKETTHVLLEYDPKLRRKVLNTYEILREIGRGEHGKVKLAKNLVNNELVAIKIVSRKLKDRLLRMRRPSHLSPALMGEYEAKIRREIAIMKRCDHKHIVRFKEVLDDRRLYKIYLVLEYMDRGEIKWKRQLPITTPRPLRLKLLEKIPCWLGQRRASSVAGPGPGLVGVNGLYAGQLDMSNNGPHAALTAVLPVTPGLATEDNDLLLNEFSPNLTFRQLRRIFRDVLLGLEYLHMQGIVHRDIKPANLLVSSDYTVKILDFGVSFASLLGSTDDGIYFSDMELAKTVGTPAFFAPELCQTPVFDTGNDSDEAGIANSPESPDSPGGKKPVCVPKVDHKIDIWAMGVTLYCLLFGRVPFNADSEFALFDVIVNEPLQFPELRTAFFPPQEITEHEFGLAKDLLSKMLEKDSLLRIDITEIKLHPFVLMDLDQDPARLQEFLFLNVGYAETGMGRSLLAFDGPSRGQDDSPTVGVGKRVGGSILRALSNDSAPSLDVSPIHATAKEHEPKNEHEFEDGDERAHEHAFGRNGRNRLRETSTLQTNHAESGVSLPFKIDTKSSPSTPAQLSGQWSPQYNSPNSPYSPNAPTPQGSQVSHTRAISPLPYPRRGSLAISNPLLQDVLDFGATIRRDSQSSQEAPQIETKRNVGGDLYMKNQSAIDAFKDIQKSDKKRRKSSIFATLSRSSSISGGKHTKALDDSPTQTQLAAPVPISSNADSLSKIKIGPISIDSNRRPSSVISLPLTESFASLDSFNDAYLTSKYQEHRKKKQAMRLLSENVTHSDPTLTRETDTTQGISEKFRNFNLGHLMSKEGKIPSAEPASDHDEVEPRAPKKTFINLNDSASDSYSSQSSCSLSSSSENEEEGNLTLKFQSKVAPRLRPPFLSLSNRAFSHESNLTDLAHLPKTNYYTPYLFQGLLHELEDVPESLIGGSSAALLPVVEAGKPANVAEKAPPLALNELLKLKIGQNNPVQSSPLRTEIVGTPDSSKLDAVMHVALDEHLSRQASERRDSTIDEGYFNNHYKKEHVRYPLPFSKHLDADKESRTKQRDRGKLGLDARPSYNRSNSITLGLLQHEPADLE